ncbi:MAG: sulfotransferase domain-containing protein [Acidimicrobiales bacterium]|nr:sulfotransferase domain-containing protein [Acidimicrobiales bacterium]
MAEPERNFLFDSTRWEQFPFREGDIVIATPAKCGTTWTQRIVSLLVFDSPELYAPMAKISPWLDMNTRTLDGVLADLENQTHRRFMKSHLDYEHLPHGDGVTYITVGRDPRDAALSWVHHMDNIDMHVLVTERIQAVGADDLDPTDPPPDFSGTEADRFWRWIELESGIQGLDGMVHHLKTFWDHRDDPNVVLLHYADLQRDLVGQMAYLADRLGLERSRERLEELAPHATFDAMKAAADVTAPNTDLSLFKSNSEFFRSGATGQWRDIISETDLPRYDKRIGELADSDFSDWLHHGSATP